MKKLIHKLYGDDWVEDFITGTVIALALDAFFIYFINVFLYFSLIWFSYIIVATIASLFLMIYEKKTPKIIQRGVLYILKIFWKIYFSFWFWGVVMLLIFIWVWFFS